MSIRGGRRRSGAAGLAFIALVLQLLVGAFHHHALVHGAASHAPSLFVGLAAGDAPADAAWRIPAAPPSDDTGDDCDLCLSLSAVADLPAQAVSPPPRDKRDIVPAPPRAPPIAVLSPAHPPRGPPSLSIPT